MYKFNARQLNGDNQWKLKSDMLNIMKQNEIDGVSGIIVEYHLVALPDDANDLEKQIQDQLDAAKAGGVEIQISFKISQAFYNFLEPEHSKMPLQVVELLFPGVFFDTAKILDDPNQIGKIAKVYCNDE